MSEIPEAAIRAAVAAHRAALQDRPDLTALGDEDLLRLVLAAAVPHLTPDGPDLTGARWRQGGSHAANIWAQTGGDNRKADSPAGRMDSAEIAARACADHNTVLSLTWLLAAGLDVQLGVHDHGGGPAFYVRLPGDPGEEALAEFSGRGSLGQALADARGWSEREGITP